MTPTALTDLPTSTWTNWAGNQSFTSAFAAAARDEEEVAALVRQAAEPGVSVRVAGAGHSFTSVVETDGVPLDLKALRAVLDPDPVTTRVTATGELRDIGENDPDLLRAAKVAVGMLGVVTRLELDVTDAYHLHEQVSLRSWVDVMEPLDDFIALRRELDPEGVFLNVHLRPLFARGRPCTSIAIGRTLAIGRLPPTTPCTPRSARHVVA